MSDHHEPRTLTRQDGTTTLSWGDKRGYRWAPFTSANEAALRHGARSDRHVLPLASELVEGLLVERPDLEQHPEAVQSWARAEARVILMSRADFLDDDGKPINSTDVVRFERQAREARHELGLGPRSEADLRRSQAEAARHIVDLDKIRQRGRDEIARRRPELEEGPGGLA